MKMYITKKKIPILFDKRDLHIVKRNPWYIAKDRRNFYVYYREYKSKLNTRLHTVIMNPSKGMVVDHINGNGLDNRRKNLRVCFNSENVCNRKRNKNNSTGYKGVVFDKRYTHRLKPFATRVGNKEYGRFKTKEEAALKYNEIAKVLFKGFARLNII